MRPLRTIAVAVALVVGSVLPVTAASADPNPYNDPNLVSMFDGTSLDGWTQAKDGQFTVANGAIHANGTARGWIYYNRQQAGTFRWIFQVRQGNGNPKPTVLIQGTADPL